MKPIRKNLALLFFGLALLLAQVPVMTQPVIPMAKPVAGKGCQAILQHSFARLQDEVPQDLCQFAGKVVLVVNTASYCGFTSQYESLEALYAKYQSRGLVVLGFPSNDFGQQEPGSAKEIADLCYNTYGVKFPMFAKTVVSGKEATAFYRALAKSTGKVPQWNFHKYLIDRNGVVISSFASNLNPQSSTVTGPIEQALAKKP